MEISTCGVKKCMGGVPFSADRNESYIIDFNQKKLLLISTNKKNDEKMGGKKWKT